MGLLDSGYEGESLFLVVGCPRSGTTWLQRLLASHPRVRTGQESNLFDAYLGPPLRHFREGLDPKHRGGVGMGCYLTEERFFEVFRPYCAALIDALLAGLGPGEVFLEKTPTHGLYLEEIHAILPQAKVIHVLRDARDVVASLLAAHRGWGRHWAPRDSVRATITWLSNVRAIRKAIRESPDLACHETTYERLHADTEGELAACASFLGLDWDSAGIAEAVERNDARRRGDGAEGTPIPVGGEVARRVGRTVKEPPGFVRKARVGSWRTDLGPSDRLVVWLLARKLMRELGYRWGSVLS